MYIFDPISHSDSRRMAGMMMRVASHRMATAVGPQLQSLRFWFDCGHITPEDMIARTSRRHQEDTSSLNKAHKDFRNVQEDFRNVHEDFKKALTTAYETPRTTTRTHYGLKMNK